MKRRDKFYFALDLGAEEFRLVVAKLNPETDDLEVIGEGYTHSEGFSRGEVSDHSNALNTLKSLKRKVEKEIGISMEGTIYIGINHPSFSSTNNQIPSKMNQSLRQINQSEINSLHKNINIFQDRMLIATIVEGYFLDGKFFDNLSELKGVTGTQLSMIFHQITAEGNYLSKGITPLLKEAEIFPKEENIFFSPLPLSFKHQEQKPKKNLLLIDIGKSYTGYIFYKKGKVFASGCIPVGGEQVTNDISVCTNIRFDLAEKEKRKGIDFKLITPDNSNSASLVAYARMKEIFLLIYQEVERQYKTLSSFHQSSPCWEGIEIILAGGGSQLKGCEKIASSVFGLPINKSGKVRSAMPEALFLYGRHMESKEKGVISSFFKPFTDLIFLND